MEKLDTRGGNRREDQIQNVDFEKVQIDAGELPSGTAQLEHAGLLEPVGVRDDVLRHQECTAAGPLLAGGHFSWTNPVVGVIPWASHEFCEHPKDPFCHQRFEDKYL